MYLVYCRGISRGNMIMNKGIHPGASNRLEQSFAVCFGASEKLVSLYAAVGSLP